MRQSLALIGDPTVQALQQLGAAFHLRRADDDRIEARVESICQKGCREVRRDIASLQLGDEIAESRGLSRSERDLLLRELQQIMAVYGDTCRLD